MFDDYVALDVETASYGASICSIGIVLVIGGIVEERFYSLVRPTVPFSEQNIFIHGITPEMVKDAPTFPELWERIRHYFIGLPTVAHNATFDLGQIAMSLEGIEDAPPSFYYLDTVTLSRKAFPGLESYSLGKLSHRLGLPSFDHHNALADAEASQALFERARSNLLFEPSFLRRYSLERGSSLLTGEDFFWSLEVREGLVELSPSRFLTESQKAQFQTLLSTQTSIHPGVSDLAQILRELLEDGYVFNYLPERMELLWSRFFPNPGWSGLHESLKALRSWVLSGLGDDASLWLRYHQELQDDPLISPLFSLLTSSMKDALSYIDFLLSPFDPPVDVRGKKVATCGTFAGTSAQKYAATLSGAMFTSSIPGADVLIVGASNFKYQQKMREAMLRRLRDPSFRILLQSL